MLNRNKPKAENGDIHPSQHYTPTITIEVSVTSLSFLSRKRSNSASPVKSTTPPAMRAAKKLSPSAHQAEPISGSAPKFFPAYDSVYPKSLSDKIPILTASKKQQLKDKKHKQSTSCPQLTEAAVYPTVSVSLKRG